MRTVEGINRGWRYTPDFKDSYLSPDWPIGDWESVSLPHTNRELPCNGFDESIFQFRSCYARDLDLPPLPSGKRAFLDFEGVMSACRVWVDGEERGSHEGGFTPFSVEIGPAEPSARGGRFRVVVEVDSTERPDIPPFGNVVDYLSYGGIYREVSLRIQEGPAIVDVFARPTRALETLKALGLDVEVEPGAGAGEGARSPGGGTFLACELYDGEACLARAETVPGKDGRARLALEGLPGISTWDLDSPKLYELVTTLTCDGVEADRVTIRVGWREAGWTPEGFRLNGRLLPVVGLNRHQSWPYSGFAMPRRAQRRDAEILKRELGVNLVRTSHYPQSRHFLDACDELGLLVLEELPGWQHIGDKAWKERSLGDLEAMIRRDRNRPSIVLWGVRINESQDDHDFYAATNALARSLDPTRSTGGVRFIEKSELLEDVYTFNDFSHAGGPLVLKRPRRVTGLRKDVPYLVTEHNGHMFPTKRFDNEERLVEHALRHARVLEASRAVPGIAGAIGWCAFDYNTHKDFGSGDRVCYHGVMDMFRMPKYAAWVYASQRDPRAPGGVVLEAASLFAKGERASARLLPVVVFTNCDEVELWRSGRRIGSYRPAREDFPHLGHPPVVIRDLIGDQLEDSRFSPRDRVRMKKLIAKVLEGGMEALGLLDGLVLAWILLRYRMTIMDAEALVGRYTLAWGQAEDSWELVGFSGGSEVARRRYGGDAWAARLVMEADDLVLSQGDWDTTRVTLRLEDQYGNLQPFASEAVELEVGGPGRVIGPTRVALAGGCIAFWVRSEGAAGRIEVRARGSRFEAGPLAIEVR